MPIDICLLGLGPGLGPRLGLPPGFHYGCAVTNPFKPLLLGAALALAVFPALAQDGPIRLLDVAPLSGEGDQWRDGVELALREIGARGGILGRPVLVTHSDLVTRSDTLSGKPDLVLMLTPAMSETGGAAEAPRLSVRPEAPLARLADYAAAGLKARSVAVASLSADDRAALSARLAARSLRLTEITVEPQQVDFSAAVIRIKNSDAEALILLLPETEAVRLLQELRRQGYDKPILGGTGLLAPSFLERTGDTANGVRALAGLEPGTPIPAIRDFVRKYQQTYRTAPGPAALRGYAALYAAKVVAAKAGRLDRASVAAALKDTRFDARAEPGLLLDAVADESGTLAPQTLVFEIRDRQPVIVDSVPGAQ